MRQLRFGWIGNNWRFGDTDGLGRIGNSDAPACASANGQSGENSQLGSEGRMDKKKRPTFSGDLSTQSDLDRLAFSELRQNLFCDGLERIENAGSVHRYCFVNRLILPLEFVHQIFHRDHIRQIAFI